MNACGLVAKSSVLVGFVLVLVSSVISCVCFEVSYGYPPPAFANEELLLDESSFPEGWQANEWTYNPRERLPADQTGRSYTRHDCPRYSVSASHSAYRFFEGANSAVGAYQQYVPIWFAPREGWEPWTVPAELPYQSTVADEFHFGCRTEQGDGAQFCQAVGRYDEYIVRFHIHMDSEPEYPDCMSFADLERILVAIDDRMAFYLGKDME